MTTHGVSINTLPSGGGGIGSGGGSGSPLEVQDEGVTVDANATLLDFVGAGVTASSIGAGQVQVNVPGPVGHWAGSIPAASFAGSPLKATVTFPSAHPSGVNYSIASLEGVVIGSGLSLDISYENKTANGFDVVLGTAGPLPNLIQVDWQVQPHGTASGTFGQISLPGIQNILIVDKGSNVTENGSQQFPYHTINAAVAAAGSGDLVLVYPGVYTEQVTPVDGVTVRGIERSTCILQNIGSAPGNTPLATVNSVDFKVENMTITATGSAGSGVSLLGSSENLTLRDAIINGSLFLLSSESTLLIEERSELVGAINVADATVIIDGDCQIDGGAQIPLNLLNVDSLVRVIRSRVVGGVGEGPLAAVAFNAAGTLELAYSVVFNANPASNPFSGVAATYKSHHCTFGSDPESGGTYTNAIAPGQRYDTMDPLAGY